MSKLSVKDSVVTINVGGQDGPRPISEVLTDYRQIIRSLHRRGDKGAAREIDTTIDELLSHAKSQQAAGLPSNAASFYALQGLGHLRRGRANKMAECISEALSQDPHCEQAHLIAGEFAYQQSHRLNPGRDRKNAFLTAMNHHRDVWEHATSGGARNNAGYHLCLELIELERFEEATKVKQELIESISNPETKARVEAIDISLD